MAPAPADPRLDVRWDVETLINIPTTMLIGIVLVIFAFNLALPISQLVAPSPRGTLGIALACVLLSFLMMITRAQGDAAGDRLPVDGERPVLRGDQRRPTACRWWSSSASRSTCWSAC